jgi:hypothetical protein
MNYLYGSYTTDQFTYSKDSKSFIAEASDLAPIKGKLFTEVCGAMGLYLRSMKTNRVVSFYIDTSIGDKEGDIHAWKLKPTSWSIWANPGLEDVSLIIIND